MTFAIHILPMVILANSPTATGRLGVNDLVLE